MCVQHSSLLGSENSGKEQGKTCLISVQPVYAWVSGASDLPECPPVFSLPSAAFPLKE